MNEREERKTTLHNFHHKFHFNFHYLVYYFFIGILNVRTENMKKTVFVQQEQRQALHRPTQVRRGGGGGEREQNALPQMITTSQNVKWL